MKFSTGLSLLTAALQTATAHTVFSKFFVEDVDQGDATCVRMPMTPANATFPINHVTSEDMACGFDGTRGVARVCPVNRGARLTFQFRTVPANASAGSIDPSHKGPCAIYMKYAASAVDDHATGPGWFKIWSQSYQNSTEQWCTEIMIENNGTLEAHVPLDLVGGYYLVRTEILSLHQADKVPPNPQFYVGCAQIFLATNGTALPESTVSIPGYLNNIDPAILFNIYNPKWPNPEVGPRPYFASFSRAPKFNGVMVQDDGLLPRDTVAVNANWWGRELQSYTDEDGCWNASAACYNQTTTCYDSAPPTGNIGCRAWEAKCTAIQWACGNGTFVGPPNKGMLLTPGIIRSNVSVGISSQSSSSMAPLTASATTDQSYTSTTQLPSIQSSSTSDAFSSTGMMDSSLSQTTTSSPLKPSSASHQILSSSAALTATTSPVSTSLPTSSDISTSILPTTTKTSTTSSLTEPFAAAPTTLIPISPDGSCGPSAGYTCLGSSFGRCCSSRGWCGNSFDYCSVSLCMINAGYGECVDSMNVVDTMVTEGTGRTMEGATSAASDSDSEKLEGGMVRGRGEGRGMGHEHRHRH